MKKPFVSVIIPTFNSALWIRECVESVSRQTHPGLEIIIVDDGSTDDTLQLIAALQDSRVKVVRTGHRGAAAARNAGLEEAGGDYVQYLDSDDLLSHDKIELQLEALLKTGDAKALASCAWGRFAEDPEEARARPEAVWTVEDPADWLVCSLGGGGMMQPGAWLVPRPVVDAAGSWDESLTLHDDGEYFTRVLLHASRQVFVPGPLVYYRTVPGSLSRKRNRAAIESAFRVCRSRDSQLLARRDDEEARRAVATQYAQFLYEFSSAAPDLGRVVKERMTELSVKPFNVVGGRNFRRLAGLFGFRAADFFRSFLRSGH